MPLLEMSDRAMKYRADRLDLCDRVRGFMAEATAPV